MWENHREAMIRRIKAGKASSFENPTVQDFISALKTNVSRALEIYEKLRKKDWNRLKQVMDAIEDILPIEVKIAWQVIESIHDKGVRLS